LSVALASALLALGAGATAHAADSGNWSNGCVSGKICFWSGAVGSTPAISSDTRDSDFRDNSLNGRTLDEGAQWVSNNFTGSGKVHVFKNINYVLADGVSACFGKGTNNGAWTILTSHSNTVGVSSFNGC
jgi:hypothetical protein